MEQVIFTSQTISPVKTIKKSYSKSTKKLFSKLFAIGLRLFFCATIIFMILSFPFDVFKQLLPSDIILFCVTLLCGFKIYGDAAKGEGYIKGYNDAIDEMQAEA